MIAVGGCIMSYRTAFHEELYSLIISRKHELPKGSYTTYLFSQGRDEILKKVGEEAVEVVLAAKGGEPEAVINETADLVYHLMVMLADQGIEPVQIENELKRRFERNVGPETTGGQ